MRTDLLCWRKTVNQAGKYIKSKDEIDYSGGNKRKLDDKGDAASDKSNKSRRKTNRRSSIKTPGSEYAKDPKTVKVRFLSDEDADNGKHADSDDDSHDGDSRPDGLPSQECAKSKKSAGSARRGIAQRSKTVANTIVLDTGCETSVIGGGAWKTVVLHKDASMHLGGPTPGLGINSYPIADRVTAVTTNDGNFMLLGVEGATYNKDC